MLALPALIAWCSIKKLIIFFGVICGKLVGALHKGSVKFLGSFAICDAGWAKIGDVLLAIDAIVVINFCVFTATLADDAHIIFKCASF